MGGNREGWAVAVGSWRLEVSLEPGRPKEQQASSQRGLGREKGKVSIRLKQGLGGGWSSAGRMGQCCWGSAVRTRCDGLKDEDLSFNPTSEERGGIWGSLL